MRSVIIATRLCQKIFPSFQRSSGASRWGSDVAVDTAKIGQADLLQIFQRMACRTRLARECEEVSQRAIGMRRRRLMAPMPAMPISVMALVGSGTYTRSRLA